VEKRTPHFDLARVQADLRDSGRPPLPRPPWMADGPWASLPETMTTYADHRVWQDVYHAATPVRKEAYIKITLRDAAPVIQFKER
jgi:hypothetical protein